MPTPRHNPKWQKAYNKRTSVKRVFSRVDGVFGFDHHTIQGKAKMDTRLGLALILNVCMALGWIRLGYKDKIRSFLEPIPIVA